MISKRSSHFFYLVYRLELFLYPDAVLKYQSLYEEPFDKAQSQKCRYAFFIFTVSFG